MLRHCSLGLVTTQISAIAPLRLVGSPLFCRSYQDFAGRDRRSSRSREDKPYNSRTRRFDDEGSSNYSSSRDDYRGQNTYGFRGKAPRKNFSSRDNYSSRDNFRSSNGFQERGYKNKFSKNTKSYSKGGNTSGSFIPEGKMAKMTHIGKSDSDIVVTLESLLEKNVISRDLYDSISRMGFEQLTPVQQKTIEPIITNSDSDIIARAKTGTGKTFAFLLPIFQHLLNTKIDSQNKVKSVIVAPTRDLALQIEDEVRKIHSKNRKLKAFECVSLVGGTNFDRSIRYIEKVSPSIVIGTPGRLIDVMEKFGNKFFKDVDFKVLDEADRLLEIGFKEDLSYINKMLNTLNTNSTEHIRTLLFSATLDHKVQSLSNDIMNKEECLYIDTIDENEPQAHEKIDQTLVVGETFADNLYAAIEHIREFGTKTPNYKSILFLPTVKFTKFMATILKRQVKLPIYEFHGQIDQKKRTRIVNEFKTMKKGLLVCTDVGARGMDFPNITEVLQIGLPSEIPNYIHRIGRTARSGKEGSSVTFISKEELPFFEILEDKHNVTIKNIRKFEAQPHVMADLSLRLHVSEDELQEIILSVISFYRACLKDYGINYKNMLPQIAHTYGTLLQNEDKRIPLAGNHILNRLGMDRDPIATKMFQIDEMPNQYNRRGPRSNYNRRRF
ncbi:uncharacterized protein GVI51_F05203 [Nakaseomyces glabratus]|uniref:ATP-dependent RNA helicase MSS116, mitochondrial n=1 Tax=Candida glabrata (strain ATCC 2001 / BCRC 20586 / JCM 3761 / NBRC 0622 / NRRL Y-65 / CBS 138) TaxID=284593 RepID=MS116_CANGA|nr:uncharacterized protein CAGL0F05577g [Nakaseomyces glabratus]Q6FU81.1 RecName: Full=ATP-dependent RNA helicase MSS116, mitochondrial; Flags: Precursor [Nakaseomyces glabratus CBS 138]KAH7587703.1 DEAD/DEAH box helicase [Nakaseomyces glabratus]KAH7604186.1 DEAD/DEAH box helicase [Nakaseomyces glabratus]KAH7605172.1 DEAD/DEAH box helicase [Nakaseomyces glabratus]KAH7607102.1 DEAD/DEAH box helicase [Nakaseomyces glabratus]KAH7614179.1 DEAD/DEAH box helicase [Nakaseomyces glabratus]|eukprot:XP_446213.1 uncharacterized protein CAGL0F05577g [[Candida] glabrata]